MSRETLRARLAAATPGPWWNVTDTEPDQDCVYDHVWGPDGDAVAQAFGNLAAADGVLAEDDADLIANSRQDLPALLELADAVEGIRGLLSMYAVQLRDMSLGGALPESVDRALSALAALEALP